MSDSATDKERTAIPRWRPIKRVPNSDLSSIAVQKFEGPPDFKTKQDQAKLWKNEASLEAFTDLLDLGISTGNEKWSTEGAAGVLSFSQVAAPRIVEAAKRALAPNSNHHSSDIFFGIESIEPHHIFEQIRSIKSHTKEYPRNSLLYCELSRLYSIVGQFNQASDAIKKAIFISPNNRYILRSATKFYETLDEAEFILPFLRNSEGFSYDPWIQSAELAAAQSSGRSTQLPKRRLRDLKGRKVFTRSESELGTGFASLELQSGLKLRNVNSILRAALHTPTENAIAQAMWVSQQSSFSIVELQKKALLDPQAWEARSRALYLERQFVDSEKQAVLWFADQQLEVRAALAATYLNLIQLQKYDRAVDIAERGIKLHPHDWSMRNCAALANAYAGHLDRAEAHIKVMSRDQEHDDELPIFTNAAKGFVAFARGNIESGRQFYERSIRSARKLARPSLIVNASIYWLEREAFAESISKEESVKVIEEIERLLKKLPVAQIRDTQHTFEARKPVIIDRIKQTDNSQPEMLVSADRFSKNLEIV